MSRTVKMWLFCGTCSGSFEISTPSRLVAMMEKSVRETMASRPGMCSAVMFFQT